MEVNGYEVKEGLYYTEEHEWIKVDGDETLIGIADYAQSELGDIVFAELPEEGSEYRSEDVLCEVESVKAVSEVYCPVSGVVTEVNEELMDVPEEINDNPYGAWFVKLEMKDESELDDLMDSDEYAEFVENE